ncbi:MAG: hypothetical protein LBL34_04645, partial [Clostridiales bacterium]|nr:hypothetical protein [Clostridiales bacterium]
MKYISQSGYVSAGTTVYIVTGHYIYAGWQHYGPYIGYGVGGAHKQVWSTSTTTFNSSTLAYNEPGSGALPAYEVGTKGNGTITSPYFPGIGVSTPSSEPSSDPSTQPPSAIDVSQSTTYKPNISTSNPVEDTNMTISNAMASGYTKELYVGRTTGSSTSYSYEKSFTGTSTTYRPSSSDVGKKLVFYFYYPDSSSGYTGATMDSNTTNAVQAATIALVAPGYAPTGSTIPGYTLEAPKITGTYDLYWYRG